MCPECVRGYKARAAQPASDIEQRLLRALKRIDALELDVARLRCLQFPDVAANTGPVNILPSTAELWAKSNQGDQQSLQDEELRRLKRERAELKRDHASAGDRRDWDCCTRLEAELEDVEAAIKKHQLSASPATAYPPLPDEGT